MLNKIQILFQSLCNYFSKSPKRHLEFMKLAKIMAAKILKNVKIHYISMLSLAQPVMAKYKTLLMKMAFDGPTNGKAKKI